MGCAPLGRLALGKGEGEGEGKVPARTVTPHLNPLPSQGRGGMMPSTIPMLLISC
jgi:hypothetical protein